MSRFSSYTRQRGAALLVGMVIIFMLSIMGISAMKGSSLERRMTNNSVQSAVAFQTAESLTDIALDSKSNLESAWEVQGTAYRVPPIDLKNDFAIEQAVLVEYVGHGTAIGYSQGVNAGGNFAALNFTVEGGSIMTDTRTASAVTQGAYRIVPGL